jgi:hypothetical protein
MAFAFVASQIGSTAYGPFKTVSTAGTLNVAAGDLIVVYGRWYEAASGGVTISDSGSNSCTIDTEVNRGTYTFIRCGYILSASANATATFTLTTVNNVNNLRITVLQFRPDAGDTVAKDQNQATGNGWSTALLTGDISTTGDDEVTISGCGQDYGTNPTNEQIGDTAADGVVDVGGANDSSAWYRILNATAANIHGQATIGGNTDWIILLNSFKATAAAGGTNVSKYKKYYDYRRAQ